MINVTKTFFPPLEEYYKQVERIWSKEWLTNRGDLVIELEQKLKNRFNADNLIIMNNGTIPIQIALNALGAQGEIITTPFSYIATTSSILWEKCKPVFVDIDPTHLTIDENKIENVINEKTTCILATHVFGNPCNIEAIDAIAKKHKLNVIYDAAHAFDVEYKGKSIFNYGDVSTCSFHATKLFHTGEGGAAFVNDPRLMHEIYYRHNFGHDGPLQFHGLGINGKISELQAAMGLSVLPYIDEILKERKLLTDYYNDFINRNNLQLINIRNNAKWNYSYYPVVFDSESTLLKVQSALNSRNIFPRRYFYPSLNTVSFVNGESMPISESIAKRILCLPLYKGLSESALSEIVKIINNKAS